MISDSLLEYASAQYDFDKGILRFVAEGNYTAKQFYSFEKNHETYILRFAKNPVDDAGQAVSADIAGQAIIEMDWLSFLADNGISVPRPLKTADGDYTISAWADGEAFIIAAYSKMKGRLFNVNDPGLWNEKIFYNWGRVMGDMHRVTKSYKPARGIERRSSVNDIISDNVMLFPSVNKIAEELIDEITALPQDNDSFGMVHSDLGPTNFLIDGDTINVFDFEDCRYEWFAQDIGAALTFAIWFGRYNDAGYDFSNDIFKNFLAGYHSAYQLDDFWLSKIPLFLRLYQIAGFAYANRAVDPSDDMQKEGIYNIENNILFTGCNIDYSLFKLSLRA